MGKMDKEQGNPNIEKLKNSISILVKKNAELEHKFNRVANSCVLVMCSMATTLYLIQTNKEGTCDAKDMEITHSLYMFWLMIGYDYF